MSSDFRQSANGDKGGANPPSSFQGKAKKSKPIPVIIKDESLIKKNLKEGYDDYSKGEDPLSQAVKRIVERDDFSPKAIIAEVERIKRERINELKSKYPGKFEDGDFFSNNIEKPSSGTIDTETQRIFRDLKAKEGDIASVKAIEELAGLEYLEKHLEGLEERAVKMGEVAEGKIKEGLESEIKDGAVKSQKKNKFEKSKLSIEKQEEEKAEKPKKGKKIEPEKKLEESKSAESQTEINTSGKIELDSDDEESSFNEDDAKSAKEAKETTEHFKSIPNFDGKVKKIKKDIGVNKERQEAEKETVEMSAKENIKEVENKSGLNEFEKKIESWTRDENIKEFRKKMAADTEESKKSYGEAIKEIEDLAEKEGFEGLDIDRSGRVHISTNRYGFAKDSEDSSNWIKAEYDTHDNKRVVIDEKNLKNFNEWMQTDSKESKESMQDIFKHEAQHLEGPAKKSSDKEGKEIKKRLEEEDVKIIKGEPAETLSQIVEEEHGRFYGGRDTQGRGYEMQTELQRINEDYKNIDDFVNTQARIKLGVDVGSKGLDYISKNPYILENADDILPIQHYNFIKPELKRKVVSRLEEMREDLADKYEIKQNRDNLKIFEKVLEDPASGGLDLAKRMQDNANAKIDFLAKKIDLRNELRELVKNKAEKIGKSKEDAMLFIKENKEYQKNLLERKLNQINVNIADSRFGDDPEKIKAYENEKEKIVREYEGTLLEKERNFREHIDKTIAGLNNIKNSEESASGKESGIKGLSSYFELAVKAYGNEIENNEGLNNIVEDTRKLLKDSIESKAGDSGKIDQDRALPAFPPAPVSMPMPAPMPMPVSPSIPHISHTPSRSSAPSRVSTPSHISTPSPVSSPQTSSPSQGPAKSSSSQGGKTSIKSTPSTSHPSSSQTSPASSAPARATPSISTPKTSLAPQTAAEPAPRSSPAPTPSQDSLATALPQTTNESTPTPAPAPSARHKASPAKSSLSQGAVKPPINNQDNETSTEPMSQGPSVSSMPAPPQNSPVPTQTASEPASTPMVASPSASTPSPSQASSIPTPAKTPSQLQSPEESSTDNTQKENGGEMSEEKIKEIKEKVRKQLEGSLEKKIDNGMGGVVIQDEAGKEDAAKIKMIKAMAEKEGIDNPRSRINLINSAIKADSIRVDPANREAEAQRIRKEAEEKAEKEIRKEIGGIKGRIAAKVLSKVMGMAAYKMAQELSQKANKGGSWAFFVFLITLCIAVIIDVLDIFGELLIETIIGTIIIFLICTTLSLINTFFWLFVLGGGHPKWFWKVLIRMLVGFFIVESIPILELLPFTVIIVCWNWYDYTKERNEAKRELTSFVAKNKSLLRNVSAS